MILCLRIVLWWAAPTIGTLVMAGSGFFLAGLVDGSSLGDAVVVALPHDIGVRGEVQ